MNIVTIHMDSFQLEETNIINKGLPKDTNCVENTLPHHSTLQQQNVSSDFSTKVHQFQQGNSSNEQLQPSDYTSLRCNTKEELKNGIGDKNARPNKPLSLRRNIIWVSRAHKEIATEVIKDALLLEFHANILDFEIIAHRLKDEVPNKDDWTMLLRQNKVLLINLIFGLYLTTEEAETQLQWLKAPSSTCACHLKILMFKDTLFFIKDILSLFNGDIAMQNAYLGFSETLRAKFLMNPSHKKFLFQLLFFYPGKLALNDPTSALQKCVETMLKMEMGQEKGHQWLTYAISDLGETLEAIAMLFEHSGLASYKLTKFSVEAPGFDSATMGFTIEEDMWLAARKDESLDAMEAIQMGPEFAVEVREFALNRKPLSPNFAVMATYGFQERLWRLYRLHPEFQDLSRKNQVKLVQSGIHIFWALMASRMHGVPMVEQVKFNHSETEISSNSALKEITTKDAQNGATVRAIRTEDVFPGIPKKMVDDCIQKLQPLLRRNDDDMTFFALLVLSVYGRVIPNKPKWKNMRSVGKKYELVIARKYAARKEAAKLHNAVSNLNIIASILPLPL